MIKQLPHPIAMGSVLPTIFVCWACKHCDFKKMSTCSKSRRKCYYPIPWSSYLMSLLRFFPDRAVPVRVFLKRRQYAMSERMDWSWLICLSLNRYIIKWLLTRLQSGTMAGKLKGTMDATTPTGRLTCPNGHVKKMGPKAPVLPHLVTPNAPGNF